MYRNLILVMCVLCAAILVGCSKTEMGNSNTAMDNSNKGTTTKTEKTTTSSGEKIGIAECDELHRDGGLVVIHGEHGVVLSGAHEPVGGLGADWADQRGRPAEHALRSASMIGLKRRRGANARRPRPPEPPNVSS